MSNKTVIVEMPEDVAAWLMLNSAIADGIRIIGEFVPTVPRTPNKVANGGRPPIKQEFPRGTKLRCGHRPPVNATTRLRAWEVLKDKFGDMVITAKDARDTLLGAGVKSGSGLVTKMLRERELKPVQEG